MSELQVQMLETMCVLVKCPATGRVLMGMKNDDKVCCGCCTKTTHRIAECQSATAQEYLSQMEGAS